MDGMDSMNGALFLFCLVPASLFDSYSMRIKEREKKNEKRFPCHRPYCPYRPWRLERRSPRSLRWRRHWLRLALGPVPVACVSICGRSRARRAKCVASGYLHEPLRPERCLSGHSHVVTRAPASLCHRKLTHVTRCHPHGGIPRQQRNSLGDVTRSPAHFCRRRRRRPQCALDSEPQRTFWWQFRRRMPLPHRGGLREA